MSDNEIVISKANSIRFAIRDNLLPSMDNRLSCEEQWSDKPTPFYKQTFFQHDSVLLQVKAGLVATPTVTVYNDSIGSYTLTADAETTYDEFVIFEYLLNFNVLGTFQIEVDSLESSYASEVIQIIEQDDSYRLVQWTNFDVDTSTFEFDYNTSLSAQYVNFMRILAEDLVYTVGGEKEVYDNQNEKSVVKANSFGIIRFDTEAIPRQIAQVLSIAMDHDRFLVNEVAYVVESKAEINNFGAWFALSAEMTLNLSLGINTHDIGYNCDTQPIMTTSVQNLVFKGVFGAFNGTVDEGYSLNQIIIEQQSGDAAVQLGSTPGGDEIMKSYTVTAATKLKVFTRNYIEAPGLDGSWVIYGDVTSGTADVYLQFIKVTEDEV